MEDRFVSTRNTLVIDKTAVKHAQHDQSTHGLRGNKIQITPSTKISVGDDYVYVGNNGKERRGQIVKDNGNGTYQAAMYTKSGGLGRESRVSPSTAIEGREFVIQKNKPSPRPTKINKQPEPKHKPVKIDRESGKPSFDDGALQQTFEGDLNFDNYQKIPEGQRAQVFQNAMKAVSQSLGLPADTAVIAEDDSSFNARIKNMGYSVGGSVKGVAYPTLNKIVLRRSEVVGAGRDIGSFSDLFFVAFHEIGHLVDYRVRGTNMKRPKTEQQYEDSKEEAFANWFGSAMVSAQRYYRNPSSSSLLLRPAKKHFDAGGTLSEFLTNWDEVLP